jgi:phage-related protein (TIGR01555 family)
MGKKAKKAKKAEAQHIAAPPPRVARRVTAEDLAVAHAPTAVDPADVFRIPAPIPGTVPVGKPTMAQDDAFQSGGTWAAQGIALYGGFDGLQAFRGYPYLSVLAQRPEYRRGVEIIAKEMTRRWIRLHSKSSDKSKNDYIGKLNDAMEKFRVQDVFREAAEHDGFFGKGQIYIDTGAGDDLAELKTPLAIRPEKISKGGLKRLRAIEPLWTYPGTYNASDPLHRHFYNPETWYVQGKEIHRSRLLPMVSREVPDLLKPAYLFGGVSLSQMAEPYVNNWLRARQSVSDLMNAFSVMVLVTDMGGTLAGGWNTSLLNRVTEFNLYRQNRGTFVVDKETEDFKNISAPLGGLEALQAQAQEHMAAVFGIPLIKLFGISPAGLNASSEGELACFYDWISAQQEHVFKTPLQQIIDIIQLSEFGSIDPTITFSFEPLWDMKETDRAIVRKSNADMAAVYIADGVISPEEERGRLATEEDGLFDGLDMSVMPEPPEEDLEPKIGPGEKEDGDPDEPK